MYFSQEKLSKGYQLWWCYNARFWRVENIWTILTITILTITILLQIQRGLGKSKKFLSIYIRTRAIGCTRYKTVNSTTQVNIQFCGGPEDRNSVSCHGTGNRGGIEDGVNFDLGREGSVTYEHMDKSIPGRGNLEQGLEIFKHKRYVWARECIYFIHQGSSEK